MKGQVKWFNRAKGFGFIEPEDGDDLFVHISQVRGEIKDGDTVEFEIGEGPKGPIAINVKLLSKGKGTGGQSGNTTRSSRNFPLSVSIKSLKDNSKVQELFTEIEVNGSILVTWFREKGITGRGNATSQIENAIAKVQEKFHPYCVQVLEWPSGFRSPMDTKRSSHPYISHICRVAIIVHKLEIEVDDTSKYQASLTHAVHDYLVDKGKKKWTLLGDETGGLGEFTGHPEPKYLTSAMCWVAIPPGSNPRKLGLTFHATGNLNDEKSALHELNSDKSIHCFVFPFEQGEIVDGLSKMGKDPHLPFWQDTLPLVLEQISSIESSPFTIDIFVEQVKMLESGNSVLQPIVELLKTTLNDREGWKKINFDELWVLSKKPCEHPWIGYPDALGHILVDKPKRDDEARESVKSLRKRTIQASYRQSSLKGSIRNALMSTARPLEFLKSLSDISSEDLRDYIQPFFSTAINETLLSLSSGEWQDLLLHMDTHSKSKQGQNATALIHGFVNIDQTLDKLPNNSDKFDFLLAMLGTSNHIGAITQANQCTNQIELLIEGGFEPRPNRMKKFQNLSGGSKDNVFDFTHIHQLWDIPEESSDIDEETARYLGAQAQSRALRAKGDDFEEAVLIENFLRLQDFLNHDELNRRYTLHSELLMDQGDYDGARLNLEDKLPKKIEVNAKSLRNGFYLAALMKSCALSGANKSDFAEYSKSVKASFNEYHPSQRIAYWCARWASEIGQVASPVVEQCCNHLIGLMETPLFTHDAAGIILGCELLDLKNRGLIDVDVESFMENVLSNSAETTREWVAAHPPNAEDWLAPLNFNYR